MFDDFQKDQKVREVYYKTNILKKPIAGFVSGYHELPYILVSPDDKNPSNALEINGTINVSPKFVISPDMIGETFGEVFDPETFDKEIEARAFSFFYSRRKNLKLENSSFKISNFDESPKDHLDRVHDVLLRQENMKTGLIFGPKFKYYPVSVDKFIREIVDREFNF